MDGVGQPRIWRAPLHFLSAAFLAACARAELARSMGLRPGCVHRLGADFFGTIRICLCAPYAAAKFGALRRGLLHGQSQRSADDLFPQRLRGTFRTPAFFPLLFLTALQVAGILESYSGIWRRNLLAFFRRLRCRVALQRACWRHGHLFRNVFCLCGRR